MNIVKQSKFYLNAAIDLFKEVNRPKNLPKVTTVDEIRTIYRLNILFVLFLGADIVLRGLMGQWLLMYSSVFLVGALLFSRIFIHRGQLEIASITIGLAFYLAAMYHSYFLQTLYVPYFILMMTPPLAAVIMRDLSTKFLFFGLSVVLFFVCNYLAGRSLMENNLFFVGLIPPFMTMVYFYNKSQLLEEEKLALIDELENKNQEMVLFSQMMSHDLKAPLRSIKGFSGLLKRKLHKNTHTTDAEKEYLKFIMDNSDAMQHLIDDLMIFSKATTETYTFEKIDLDDLIEIEKLAFQLEINQKQLIFEKEVLGHVIANKNALKTVFHNLISNAIKYQPKDNTNHIPSIYIKSEHSETATNIYFQDNGIGIPKEYMEDLFKPFRRFHSSTEYQGSGLGLSICKKILNKHQGNIKIHTTNENGTCFRITIPNSIA